MAYESYSIETIKKNFEWLIQIQKNQLNSQKIEIDCSRWMVIRLKWLIDFQNG